MQKKTTKKPPKQLLIIVDDQLKKQVDKYCKDQGISIKALVTSSIVHYLRSANA